MTDTATWDCHVHVIGDHDRFPLSPTRGYTPPVATLQALFAHLDSIGSDRAVIVQPSVYGSDNSCLLDALAHSEGRCVGVAVPDPDSSTADLGALRAAGICGIRCNLINAGGLPFAATQKWWPWMRDHGWHLQLQIDCTRTDLEALLAIPGVPRVVIDHMGFPPPGSGVDAVAGLVAQVAARNVYVKISAPDRIVAKPSQYATALDIAAALLDAAPEYCLFGTDWPHTELTAPIMPDSDWHKAVRKLAGAHWSCLHTTAQELYTRGHT